MEFNIFNKHLIVKSGFKDLDKLIGGFNKGDLILLDGYEGHGKSSLALNIALEVARNGKSVGFFNHRMSNDLFQLKLLCQESCIPLSIIRNATISSGEYIELTNAAAKLSEFKLYTNQSGGFNENDQYDLVIVDNLRSDEKQADIVYTLKCMALKLNIPIIVITMGQLLSNSNFDLIMKIDRRVLWDQECENPSLATLEISKNRNGATGTIQLCFLRELFKFEDL